MTELDATSSYNRVAARRNVAPLRHTRAATRALGGLVWLVLLGNLVGVVWLWYSAGNVTDVHTAGDAFTSIGRLTGLLAAYSALVQVVLLARIPWIERLAGFDRLTRWHRWNGYACFWLVIAHVVTILIGYAALDRLSFLGEIVSMTTGLPGMVTAWVGTAMLVLVVATSVVIVRRRLSYEWWYAVHFLAYGGIALAWFHQIPTGNELVLDQVAQTWWKSLYVATLALIVVFRVAVPLAQALRYRLRVAEVVEEAPGVISLRITGRNLGRLRARAGQFFLWRFLDRHRWWTAHPFSLSEAPDGRSLRITVKALGDHTARLANVKPGTRVVAEGPFGVFTAAAGRRRKSVLIAGGIGITPIRAMLEDLQGDTIVVYRAMREDELVFADEIEQLDATVHYVVGDHGLPGNEHLLSAEHLEELVPDVRRRNVFLCGPPGMTAAVERTLAALRVPRRNLHVERFAL